MSEKGYKGFNKALQCCPDGKVFQYDVGKTYEETEAEICEKGFHYCEYPLDVLGYYEPGTSRFAEVEALGEVIKKADGDSKRSTTKIHIGAELSLGDLIQAAVRFVFDNATLTERSQAIKDRGAASATGDRGAASATGYSGAASATGYRGAASATGDRGAASATGDSGAASATGYSGAASATGDSGIACAHGIESKAKAALGAWIVCSEWKTVGCEWRRVAVRAAQIDGKILKADTFYTLKSRKFVEVGE